MKVEILKILIISNNLSSLDLLYIYFVRFIDKK